MKRILLKTCEILARIKCAFPLSDFWLSLRAGPETSVFFTKLHFACGLSAPALVEKISWWCSGVIGEGNGTPLQYSCLENPMDRGAWWAAVHGVAKSQTRLSDFTFTFHFHALEKEMATYSSVLAWRIPGMGEPGGLLSMGSHRVGHDWSDSAAAAAAVVSWKSSHNTFDFEVTSLCGLCKEVTQSVVKLLLLGESTNLYYILI